MNSFLVRPPELILYELLFGIEVSRFSGNPAVTSQKRFRALAKPGENKGSTLSIFGFVRLSRNFNDVSRRSTFSFLKTDTLRNFDKLTF